MGGRREVSIISHRPVTSSDLRQEMSFVRGRVSTSHHKTYRSETTLRRYGTVSEQYTVFYYIFASVFCYDKILSKTTINLLSSSVITTIGPLAFPSPFTVEANTVML